MSVKTYLMTGGLALVFVSPICGTTSIALSDDAQRRPVPTELFGITVGATYDLGNPDNGDLGNFPVKKFAGINKFLGQGFSYYFEPIKESKFFEYVEMKKKPEDKYFTTSFRAYLLPVVPPDIKSMKEFIARSAEFKSEVILIEWNSDAKNKDEAYYWAIDLCKTFSADFSVAPKITDFREEKWYECAFSSGDLVFRVSSSYSRSVQLQLNDEVSAAKEQQIENFVRRLKSKELLE